MDVPEAGAMRMLYDEHAAALWRYAFSLTGDAARAGDVVQETLLRAWRHPEVIDDTRRSPRAGLVILARQMIVDDRRGGRFHSEGPPPGGSGSPKPLGPDQNRAALDRLLVADAIAQLSADHRAVIRRSYYQGRTTSHIAADLGIAEDTAKSRLHYALRALQQVLQDMGVAR